jgi:hypothetical protein
LEPKTTKINPRTTRAIIVAIFMQGWWLDRGQIPIPKFLGRIRSRDGWHYSFTESHDFLVLTEDRCAGFFMRLHEWWYRAVERVGNGAE